MTEPRLFRRLRAAAGPAWDAYVRHEFVAGLGAGTLPRASYLHYLRQDYLFLIHFARAWAMAAVKSDRVEEIRAATATAHALIDHEMRLHVETCAAAGIDAAALEATPEAPETLAYTRFVIDAGLRGDLLDLLVAVAPCALGYGEIGQRLAAETGGPPADHPYAGWIATYADPAYQQVCANVGALMERAAGRLIGPDAEASPRWPDLARGFETACRLEAAFWEMGLRGG